MLSINIRPHEIFERDGADVYIKVEIPYSLATLGGDIKVPTVDDEVKIKIKPGTQSNTIMRLSGKGIKHLRGSGRGDEYVRILVTIPQKLSREQRNLIDRLRDEGL